MIAEFKKQLVKLIIQPFCNFQGYIVLALSFIISSLEHKAFVKGQCSVEKPPPSLYALGNYIIFGKLHSIVFVLVMHTSVILFFTQRVISAVESRYN